MHDDITDHIAYDRGYNAGQEEATKRAWDLVGELAEWYRKQVLLEKETSKQPAASGRYEATLYAQQVIKRGTI
jgi:hypothetical protein